MDTEPNRSRSLEITLGILIVLGLIAAPIIWQDATASKRARSRDMGDATSNARQIGFALFELETEYGSFPSDETGKDVTAAFPNHGLNLSGKSSNALFRQLIAANITRSEQMFYAKVKGARKPDGDISPGKALEAGEVGFGLLAGTSTSGNPARPIAFCPIIPGTTRFDPKPFDGKAIVLFIDNSVRSFDIHKDGHIYDKGIDLLSSKHPIWKGKAPDIRYPDL